MNSPIFLSYFTHRQRRLPSQTYPFFYPILLKKLSTKTRIFESEKSTKLTLFHSNNSSNKENEQFRLGLGKSKNQHSYPSSFFKNMCINSLSFI